MKSHSSNFYLVACAFGIRPMKPRPNLRLHPKVIEFSSTMTVNLLIFHLPHAQKLGGGRSQWERAGKNATKHTCFAGDFMPSVSFQSTETVALSFLSSFEVAVWDANLSAPSLSHGQNPASITHSFKHCFQLFTPCFTILLCYFLNIFFIYLWREGRVVRERGRETWCVRETAIGCLSHAPSWGLGLWTRHGPWLGIKPMTAWSAGQYSATEPHQPGLLYF